MDPLSLTASIIAVLGGGGQAAKGLRKLAAIRGTPEHVLALYNETSDLQVVVQTIQDIFDEQRTSGVPFPGQRSGELNVDSAMINSLRRANDMVAELEVFYKRLKVSTTCSGGILTFDRTLWLRELPKIKRMKENLKSVRLELITALGTLNASTLFRLETHLRIEHQKQQRQKQQAETTQSHISQKFEISIQSLHHRIDDLQTLQRQAQVTQDQRLLQHAADVRESLNRLLMTQERLELKVDALDAQLITRRTASNSQSFTQRRMGLSHMIDQLKNSETIRLLTSISRICCAAGCICLCHRRRTQRTPRVLNRIFGTFLVRYTGIPLVTPRCDSIQCVQRSAPTVQISYFLPLWLLKRALYIIADLSSMNGPQLVIRTPCIISESSLIFTLCHQGDIQGVRQLIQQGLASPLDTRSLSGGTALHMAVQNMNPELCKMLLFMGADPNQANYDDRTAYDFAWTVILTQKCNIETCDSFRALFPGDDFIEEQNFGLLHRTVLGLNPMDLNTVLADIPKSTMNKGDASGQPPLWWATSRADYEATSLLISHGADLNQRSSFGYSPLTAAITAREQKIIRFLLKHDCDITVRDPQGWLPLHRCAYFGCDLDILDTMLVRGIDINATTSSGRGTALWLATQEDHCHICEFLIARGADLDISSVVGESALHVAILNNSHKPLTFLLQNRASYMLRTKAGENILHYAAQFGDIECLRILHTHDLHNLNTEDRVIGESPTQRFKGMRDMDALQIANRRDDTTSEWHTMFGKLLHGIRLPENQASQAHTNRSLEEFHDALEYMDS